MDLPRFFESIRASVFGGRLPQSAVDGCEAILASCQRNGITDPHHVANIMAQVWHETGGYMLPIKETVFASHKDKNPPDATVIARLDRAFAAGQLTWVKTPYWRDGWFGRGQIQLTHNANYEKMGDRIGVDLVSNPSLALEPSIGSDIAVVGMSEGLFTGRKLSDYAFPAALTAVPAQNPRRIVNGQDGTDAKIARAHRQFFTAIETAGWGEAPVPIPTPRPEPIIIEEPTMPASNDGSPVEKAIGAGKGAAQGATAGLTTSAAIIVLLDQFGALPASADNALVGMAITGVLTGFSAFVLAVIQAYRAPANSAPAS